MLNSRAITSLIKLQESHCFVCVEFLKINNIEKVAFAAFIHLIISLKAEEFHWRISAELSPVKAGDKCGTLANSSPQGSGPPQQHPEIQGLAGSISPLASKKGMRPWSRVPAPVTEYERKASR